HPDGRIQRLRPAIGHPGETRMEWQVLVELARRLGLELPHLSAGMVFSEIEASVSLYRGISLDLIGARGVRWQEQEAALEAAAPVLGDLRFSRPSKPPAALEATNGSLRLVGVPSLWASWETDRSPALRFLKASQELQLNPLDAQRLGVARGDSVEVRSNGSVVRATV